MNTPALTDKITVKKRMSEATIAFKLRGPFPRGVTAKHPADSASSPVSAGSKILARRFTLPALTLAAVSK